MAGDDKGEQLRPLAAGESFRFACHPGVTCFTDCCRRLNLALSPYDVLRLSRRLELSAQAFLERHTRIDMEGDFPFPHVFLAMRDEAEGRCPFVSAEGCLVYEDRPGACRCYPLGRGAFLAPDGRRHEMHVVLTEPHCLGFCEEMAQDVATWQRNQKLEDYNAINDELMPLLQHRRIRAGFVLSEEQKAAYLLALYRLDAFRQQILDRSLKPLPQAELPADDLALLRIGIGWLQDVLFR